MYSEPCFGGRCLNGFSHQFVVDYTIFHQQGPEINSVDCDIPKYQETKEATKLVQGWYKVVVEVAKHGKGRTVCEDERFPMQSCSCDEE